jgi:hypothetical protein
MLPTKLPLERRRPKTFSLHHSFLPIAAPRRKGATFLQNTQVRYQDDGGAVVMATFTNL